MRYYFPMIGKRLLRNPDDVVPPGHKTIVCAFFTGTRIGSNRLRCNVMNFAWLMHQVKLCLSSRYLSGAV